MISDLRFKILDFRFTKNPGQIARDFSYRYLPYWQMILPDFSFLAVSPLNIWMMVLSPYKKV